MELEKETYFVDVLSGYRMIIHPREHLHEAYPPQVPIRGVHRLTGDLRASNTDAAIAVKEIVMEIGQDYFVPTPSTEDVLYKALEDIKKVIGQASYREVVGEPALTLMQIYDIIEKAETISKNKKKNG
tara:strand:+ start:112 stop:495 length:384 start_codon:yes stop_codon:yes gene_type:complete